MTDPTFSQKSQPKPPGGESYRVLGAGGSVEPSSLRKGISSDDGAYGVRKSQGSGSSQRPQTQYFDRYGKDFLERENARKRWNTSHSEGVADALAEEWTIVHSDDHLSHERSTTPNLGPFTVGMVNGDHTQPDIEQLGRQTFATSEDGNRGDFSHDAIFSESAEEPSAANSPMVIDGLYSIQPSQSWETQVPNREAAKSLGHFGLSDPEPLRQGLEQDELLLLHQETTSTHELLEEPVQPKIPGSNTSVGKEETPEPLTIETESIRIDPRLVESSWDDSISHIDPFGPGLLDVKNEHSEKTEERHSRPPPVVTFTHAASERADEGAIEQQIPNSDTPPLILFAPEQNTVQDEAVVDAFPKQLRRFRKMTDEVLLKRTNWRHEYQKLENSRRYFNKSVRRLISVIQIEPSTDVYPDSPTMGKEEQRRKAESVDGDLRDVQSNDVVVSSSSGVESGIARSSSKGLVESSASESPPSSVTNVATAQELVMKDLRALSKQEDVVKGLMEDLSNLEYHLGELEKKISDDLHSSNFADKLREDILREDLTTVDSDSRPESKSDDLPPIVSEYFDKMGDIGIYLERLQELDFNHQEGLVFRDFLRDRGDQVDLSDEVFDQNYESHRKEVEHNLNAAREAVKDLALRCAEAGLDPELYRNAARSAYSPSVSRSAHVEPTSVVHFKQSNATAPRSMSPPGPGKTSQTIEGWLNNVPGPFEVPESNPSKLSLASFELQSFDPEPFGLPMRLESG